jgi:hypothetical protein
MINTPAARLRNLTGAASRLGVTLPDPVVALLDFEPDLPVLADVASEAVEEIVAAAGTKTYAKTRDAALGRVASAQAALTVSRTTVEALDRARWSSVLTHADEVIDAFRAAIADDLATLNDAAPRVPATATQETTVVPDAYAARFIASQADARLAVATGGLAPLYDGAAISGSGDLSATHVRRMMITDVPADLPREKAQTVLRAFADTRLALRAGDPSNLPALWFAVLASLGVPFRLVTPAEHADTVARMRDAKRLPAMGEILPEVV